MAAGAAAPVVRAVEAVEVAVRIVCVLPPSRSQPGRSTPKAIISPAVALGYQTERWCDDAVMAHARMSAHTYVTHYLRNIRAASTDADE